MGNKGVVVLMDEPIDIELPERDLDQLQAEQLNDAAMAIFKEEKHGTATAMTMLRRAATLRAELPQIWGNIGLILWRMGVLDEAEIAFKHAISLDPNNSVYHGNLGVFLGAVNRPEEAVSELAECSRLDPTDLSAEWDLCLIHLRAGDWKTGLGVYDVRRKHRGTTLYPEMPSPLWRGEDLTGKVLYVQGEQGLGDRFLFSRYLAWIKEKWPECRILVCLYDPMVNLFWEFRGTVEFLPQGVPWPTDIDYSVFLCTLPELHGTTPSTIPSDPGFLRKRILMARETTKCNLPAPKRRSLKVGLCWTGNPTQTRNLDRTIPLELLIPIAEDPRICLYSFQCSPGREDLKRLAAGDLICDLSVDIEREGWVSTGIALMEMDVLVSVCTSVPHLAGAIGVPCWTMLCADPYWIWGRESETTPWYPGMRLFRQRALGDWKPVIAEVRAELSKLADITLSQ